jgi:hypothetical protein
LLQAPLWGDRFYGSRPFAIGAGDDLSIVLDNDIYAKRFDVNLYRRLLLTGSTYTSATPIVIKDYETGAAMGLPFGHTFSFDDYALVMHPRLISHPSVAAQTLLWRWKGFGANDIAMRYEYPIAPDQSIAWRTDYSAEATSMLYITLPSSAARSLNTLTNASRIGLYAMNPVTPNAPYIVYAMTGFQIGNVISDGTHTTVTVVPPTGCTMTSHGLITGNVIYITADPAIAWLPSAQYTIVDAPGPLTFRVAANTGGAQPSTAGGTSIMVFDTGAGADWSNLQVNDIVSFATTFGAWSQETGKALSVQVLDTTHHLWFKAYSNTGPAVPLTYPYWSGPLTSATANVKAFVTSVTVANLADPTTGLFANTTSNLSPVTAVVPSTGTGLGSITKATWDDTADTTARLSFVDGINYVAVTTPVADPTDYTITLKIPVSPTLTGYVEWVSEEAYLCPITTANLVAFLNAPAICGLSANGGALASSRGTKLQINTSTPGSDGSVQIRGGLANSALTSVHGSAGVTTAGGAAYVVVPTVQTSGFHANWPVKLANTSYYLKTSSISSGNLLGIAGSSWKFESDFAPNTVYEHHGKWRFEHQGKFMCMIWAGQPGGALPWSGILPGGYVLIKNLNDIDGVDTVSANNLGQFVILGMDEDDRALWFENPSGTDELCEASVRLVGMDGLISGDKIIVGTDAWGIDNRRTFTVDTVNYGLVYDPALEGNCYLFTTVEMPSSSSAVTGPQVQVQVKSGLIHSFVKTINSIVPLSENTDYSVITFKDSYATVGIGETFGTQVVALDKLDFQVATAIGNDGYQYSVGLIGEANKIMYGSEKDTVSYPGVVAAGALVNVSGPMVRRIQVGLNLRIRGSQDVIFDAVRGAVATFINNSAVGESIAISDLISAASTIGGVEAVSISSPTYNVTSDRITVQPYEKALVVQPDTDITLTLAG